MKRISLRLIVALLTFALGVSLAAVWTIRHHRSMQRAKKTDCVPTFSSTYSSKEEGWGTVLARFKEMPLDRLPPCVDESYRAIWIPTFHSPVAVRIWSSDGKRFLVTKQLDGKGGYGMGKLAVENLRALTEDEWLTFNRLLDESAYWDLPSVDTALPPNDGAEWVIEGVKDKRYHEVFRRTPSVEFRASCMYLVKLTGLQTEIDKY